MANKLACAFQFFVGVIQFGTSVEAQVHVPRVGRNMDEPLPLLTSKRERIGDTVSFVD